MHSNGNYFETAPGVWLAVQAQAFLLRFPAVLPLLYKVIALSRIFGARINALQGGLPSFGDGPIEAQRSQKARSNSSIGIDRVGVDELNGRFGGNRGRSG